MATNNSPILSVVVPVSNTEQYLPECINSILNQSWKNFELICIDDDSTDNSYKILKEYENKNNNIRVIHQKKSGVSAARNLGVKLAQGKYITFVDSDDYLDINAYETAFKKMDDNDDILVFGYRPFPEKNKWLEAAGKTEEIQFVNDSINAWFSSNANFTNWNKIYRSELIKKGNIKFSNIKYGQDQCFNMMVYPEANKIHFISDILYNYRTKRDGSSTSDYKSDIKIKSYFKMAKKVCDFWENKGCLKGNEHLLIEKFINMITREAEKDLCIHYNFDINLLDNRIFNKEIISKCSKNVLDKITLLEALYRKNCVFDEIISLGYNCEVSYRIQDRFKFLNAFLYSKVYCLDDDLFIESLDDMDNILSYGVTFDPIKQMIQCNKYKIKFHVKSKFNESKESRKKALQELISRKRYLTEKTKKLFKSEKNILFVKKIKNLKEKDTKSLINKLYKKLKKLRENKNFTLLIVLENKDLTEDIKKDIKELKYKNLLIETIEKFAIDDHTDTDGDLSGWNKVLSKFRKSEKNENNKIIT